LSRHGHHSPEEEYVDLVHEIVLKQFTGASTDTARTLRDAIDKACGLKHPDMVVLDLGLPDSRGPDTAVKFRAAHPRLRIIVLSADDDCTTIAACRKAGVAGYLPKTVDPETIAAALRTVANGGTCLPPRAAPIRFPNVDLTQRQLEVLRLIAKGTGQQGHRAFAQHRGEHGQGPRARRLLGARRVLAGAGRARDGEARNPGRLSARRRREESQGDGSISAGEPLWCWLQLKKWQYFTDLAWTCFG